MQDQVTLQAITGSLLWAIVIALAIAGIAFQLLVRA